MKNKLYKLFILMITGTIIFSSCDDQIGLGRMINLDGPVVKITAPVSMEGETDIAVSDVFNLSGTITTESSVDTLEIKMVYSDNSGGIVPVGREWKWDGRWQYKEDGNIAWRNYAVSDYADSIDAESSVEIKPMKWDISGNKVSWNLPMVMDGLPVPSDYFITVTAADIAGRRDANSTQKLKVSYDNNKPNFTVSVPALHGGRTTDGWGLMYPDYPPLENGYLFDSWVYDTVNQPDETYNYINHWVTGSTDLRWEIDKDIVGAYALDFEFTSRHNLRNPVDNTHGDSKKLYFRYQWDETGVGGNLPRRGIFTDSDNYPAWFLKIRGKINGSEITPRDISTGSPVSGEQIAKDRYTPIQIVSRLSDGAGNMTYKSNGWFAFFPDADKPWAYLDFGKKYSPNQSFPLNAPDSKYIWTNTRNDLNFAYDNEGVDSLTWELYKLPAGSVNPSSNTAGASPDGSLEKPWTGSVSGNQWLPGEGMTKRRWEFFADGSYGIGRFKIIIKLKDNNGLESDPQIAFFTIESNTTPTVKGMLASPLESETLWGDAGGNFRISGTAQVQDATNIVGQTGLKIDRVTIAWIKPHSDPNTFASRRLLYTDRDYENWNKAPSQGAAGFFEDNASRVWEIPSANIVHVLSTDGNNNGGGQEDYTFYLDLNLFTHWQIGQNAHSDQEFLIRVLSVAGGGESSTRASVKTFTSRGDFSPPVITIDKINVTRSDGNTDTYEAPFGMISLIDAGYKIKIEGTWKDDSWDKWTGVPASARLGYYKNFGVTWRGQGANSRFINFSGSFTSDGKWSTNEYTFTEENKEAFVFITASLTDLNNNVGSEDETLVVETEMPTLIRISSEISDGSYGDFKDTYPLRPGSRFIEIFLDFNKPVKFFENEGTPPYQPKTDPKKAPYLKLNNGARAYYYDGNGKNRLLFRYYINGAFESDITTVPDDASSSIGGSTQGMYKDRLNVTGIEWSDKYPQTSLVSNIDASTTQAVIHNDFFDPLRNESLAGGKDIKIDKILPVITSVVSAASDTRPHGKGSLIYITVNFSERVSVSGATTGTRAAPGSFYLNLAGGNLASVNAKALFANVSSQTSVSFLYEVIDGDDTSGSAIPQRYLSVQSIVMNSGLSIKDMAGNEINKPAAVPSGGLGRNLIIDTIVPSAPSISITGAAANNYESRSFIITGLESQSVTVEYHLDCPNPASPPQTGWLPADAAAGLQTLPVTIDRTGTYNIAARQYDNAVPANVSAVSAPAPLSVDLNPLITRLSSSTPDGDYGFGGNTGNVIAIDVYFRIPLTVTGSPYLALNVQNAGTNNNRAALKAGQTGARDMFTFEYTIPNAAANVTRLDLNNYTNSFVMNGAVFADSAGVNVNNYIDLSKVIASNRFNPQKNIQIINGYPEVINANFGTDSNSSAGVVYANNELRITFNRDISRGDTANQLVIKQNAAGYRIPAVMEETKWNAVFVNRADIWDAAGNGAWAAVTVPAAWGTTNQAKADFWKDLGEYLYPKGSNGAAAGTGNNLVSDTSVKRVLRFGVDTAAADASTADLPANVNMGNIKNVMRSAEALRFNVRDKEVSIAASTSANPASTANRTIIISLSGEKTLPVKGPNTSTCYQWIFPNGFVKDALEKPNGQSLTGSDASLTSGNPETDNNTAARRLYLNGYENPVIRIDKGSDTENFTGTGENRQAVQPLTTKVRIDGRTPGTTFQYRTRQTTDNVGQLLYRNGATAAGQGYDGNTANPTNGRHTFNITNGVLPIAAASNSVGTANGIAPFSLPNTGNQRVDDFTSYDNAKNRPQSGNSASPYLETSANRMVTSVTANFNIDWNGLNHWTPMAAWQGGYTTYTPGATVPFDIGADNYNAGGMIIHINARLVQDNNIQAYEAAYRSVFVFNNAAINNNGVLLSAANDGVTKLLNLGYGWTSMPSILPNYQLGRMWIRGGDTIGGDSSVPDFPIARDRSLSKKARLMTPIDISLLPSGQSYDSNSNATAAVITNNQIPSTYRQATPSVTNENMNYPGAYLWFWVTWKVNVNAYIDHFCGELPSNEAAPQVPVNYKELYKGIMPSKEHYPVIPGRTTVFETRRVFRLRYGGQGGQLDFGPLSDSPRPSDLTAAELALLGW